MFLPISVLNFSSDWFLQTTSFNIWVHINLSVFVTGRRDSSGIRLWYTPSLRRFDAGIMELGLVYTPVMAIPPRQRSFQLTGYCTAKCTQTVRASQTLLNTALHSSQPKKRCSQSCFILTQINQVHTATAFSLRIQLKHIEWIPENRLRPRFTKVRNHKRLRIKKEKHSFRV